MSGHPGPLVWGRSAPVAGPGPEGSGSPVALVGPVGPMRPRPGLGGKTGWYAGLGPEGVPGGS